MRPVVFLTDFGLADAFVGTCHAVMRRIVPGLEIVDLSHGIAAQNVLQGALALHDAAPFLPAAAIVVAVVDPGVGSSRRAIAVRGGDRRFWIGPDNGLLLLAAERVGPIFEARELADPRWRLDPVSATFHGRDIFAPAAAHLASGVSFSELGPTIDPSLLVRIEVPVPVVAPGSLEAQVVAVDRFGNLQLAAGWDDLIVSGFVPGAAVEVSSAHPDDEDVAVTPATVGRTFADVASGALLVHEDASGRLAVALSGGSAAAELAYAPGHTVTLFRPGA